jgi:hypothetical protein
MFDSPGQLSAKQRVNRSICRVVVEAAVAMSLEIDARPCAR